MIAPEPVRRLRRRADGVDGPEHAGRVRPRSSDSGPGARPRATRAHRGHARAGRGVLLAAAMVAVGAAPDRGGVPQPGVGRLIRRDGPGVVIFGFTIVPAAMLQRAYRQRTLFVVNGLASLVSTATIDRCSRSPAVGPVALAVRAGREPGHDRRSASSSPPGAAPPRLRRRVARESARLLPAAGDGQPALLAAAQHSTTWWSPACSARSSSASTCSRSTSRRGRCRAVGQAVRVVALPAFAQVGSPRGAEPRPGRGHRRPSGRSALLLGWASRPWPDRWSLCPLRRSLASGGGRAGRAGAVRRGPGGLRPVRHRS